jgi:acetyl esterase/lipase
MKYMNCMNKKWNLLAAWLLLSLIQLQAQEVIPLYPGLAPGSLPVEDKEVSAKSNAGNQRTFVSNVTKPTLTVFLPKKQNPARAAVVICPGGGYSRLSIEDGGYEAARAFADKGIVAVVLKYRTTAKGAYVEYTTLPMRDAEQALQIVQDKARDWQVDPTKIGMLGFSAGGHLVSMCANYFEKNRPAFTLLAYPVISFMDSLTSPTSNTRANLLGKHISEADKIKYSPELQVSKQTPPAFILHAKDDSTSWVGNSVAYYRALRAKQVAATLKLYEKGGHGFAMYNKAEDSYWLSEAIQWLTENGFYQAP